MATQEEVIAMSRARRRAKTARTNKEGAGAVTPSRAQAIRNAYNEKITSSKELSGEGTVRKKMTGVGFYLIVGIAALKDLMDAVLDATVILSILTFVFSIIASAIIFTYLYSNGVRFTDRKLATFAAGFVVELVPFLNILPASVIMLFVIRELENNAILKQAADTVKSAKVLAKST